MATKKEKPKHLGRGLKSLLGELNLQDPPQTESEQAKTPSKTQYAEVKTASGFSEDHKMKRAIREIKTSQITPNPYQPRTQWDQEKLEELAMSIKANGIIQPVIVRAVAGGYEIIAGERRCRAAQMAGLESVPVLVRDTTDEEMLEIALVENIHRADLNPIERAKAYRKYLETFKMTQSEGAEKLGENRSVVANYMRLLDLPEDIRQMVSEGELSMGHARAILALPNANDKRKIANKSMAGQLSVREVERWIRNFLKKDDKPKEKPQKAAHIVDLETMLKRKIGTNVNIDTKRNGQRGKITIEFYSLDDFDRITGMLGVDAMEYE